jgi:hypothetical protein
MTTAGTQLELSSCHLQLREHDLEVFSPPITDLKPVKTVAANLDAVAYS